MVRAHALKRQGGGVKILVVSDIHYSLPQFDWLLQRASDYDLVIIAGDLLDTNSPVDLGTQVVVVLKYLKRIRLGAELLVCSGNHDLDSPNALGEMHASWARALRNMSVGTDGDTVLTGDVTVTCCPWWDGPETLKEIGAQLEAAAEQRRGRWIWVYHAPPPDSPVSWNGHRHFGDQALNGWIAQHQPDIVLCGHVHEAPFARDGSWVDRIGQTWLFNAGRQIGDIPTTISIDTKAGEAAWFSMEGAEAVKLDAPLIRPVEPLTAMPAWMPRAADPT
jgi:Icc-related predicted phosphoesterase